MDMVISLPFPTPCFRCCCFPSLAESLSFSHTRTHRKMAEAAMGSVISSCWQNNLSRLGRVSHFSGGDGGEWKGTKALLLQLRKPISRRKANQLAMVKNQVVDSASSSTYHSRIATDIPLHESPLAPFDQYLEDKTRVFEAIFPDKRRSRRLKEEEWRIHMLPIQFLFLTVSPVVDVRLRCKTKGIDYPTGVPPHITKVLELVIIRWELLGLDDVLKPSQFSLGIKGALYPDRQGGHSRIKGQLHMSMSFVLPPVLSLIPEEIRRDVAESVLSRLVENMKHKVNGSLIADYSQFKREKSRISFKAWD